MNTRFIGYSRNKAGHVHMLGTGDIQWLLTRRMPAGHTELITVVDETPDFEAPYERDVYFEH